MSLMQRLHNPNRAPGDIPLTPEQEASTNWFWVAVREANSHARALQDMSTAERDRAEKRLLDELGRLV
jgi:hypothetical protein